MKIVSRLIAAILFILFFFFALKNTQEITLHFFLGYERTDPLVLVLAVCFVGGVVLGVLAMTPIVFRHRREVSRHKKAANLLQKEREVEQRAQQSPQPDSVVPPQHLI
jgi:putative membrane protein